MKGIILPTLILTSLFLVSCTPTQTALAEYKYEWAGSFSYNSLFDATLAYLKTTNEKLIDANRDKGIIHTQEKNVYGQPVFDDTYLLTSADNSVYYTASASFAFTKDVHGSDDEIVNHMNKKIYANISIWKSFQAKVVEGITKTYNDLLHKTNTNK